MNDGSCGIGSLPVCLGFCVALFFGCSPIADTADRSVSMKKEGSMLLSGQSGINTLSIPPMDAVIPERIETASFGLG